MVEQRTSSTLALLVFFLCSMAAIASDTAAANWTQLTPATSPPARSYLSMAYDPVSRKILLFGGFNGTYLNDTWTFDGTTWTQVKTATSPPVRTNATMAFDRVTREIVLFGGYNGFNYLGDTWLWDGSKSTWTQAGPITSPKAVTGPMLFTDPVNGACRCFRRF